MIVYLFNVILISFTIWCLLKMLEKLLDVYERYKRLDTDEFPRGKRLVAHDVQVEENGAVVESWLYEVTDEEAEE